MKLDYRKLKDEWKQKGEIPDWYSTNALQFFMDKYSYQGETVRSRDTAVAKYLAKHAPSVYPDWWEEDEYTQGKTYEQAFFDVIWDGFAVLSTPLKANAGLPQRGLTVSCCGQHMGNSVASKAFIRGELEVLIKNSHGCSMSVSDWLAEGTVYDKDGNISAGIEPVIDDMQKSTFEINQGIRRGQTQFGVNILHGDFDKIANKLFAESDSLNISWLIGDDFIGRLQNGDKEAIRRFGRVVQVRMQTGKGYFTKIDTMNRNKAQVFKDLGLKVHASNLCVAPETMILTDRGYETISDLEGQDVTVWNGEEWSTTTVVKTSPLESVVSVDTDDGATIDCTKYHKWYVAKRDKSGKLRGMIEKRTHELQAGDELIKSEGYDTVLHGSARLDFPYESGFVTGDGCERGRTDDKGLELTLYKQSNKFFLKDVFKGYSSSTNLDGNAVFRWKYGTLLGKYNIPDSSFVLQDRLQWLAGLLDADGSILKGGESFILNTSKKDFAQKVKLFLQELGVDCTCGLYSNSKTTAFSKKTSNDYQEIPREPLYVVRVHAKGVTRLLELGLKCKRLDLVKSEKSRSTSSKFVKIVSVSDFGRETPVFCFTEPKRHMGMFNGILTGQCNEVNLPANDEYSFTCVIINANLALYEDFPEHLYHILHIMQDCNVSGYIEEIEKKTGESRVFLSKVLKFTKDFRAVGTGVCGFHSLLMKKRIVFGSFDSMILNEEIFKRMRNDLDECNAWLAEVLGEPDKLKGYGKRNATVMMMPPTKSSAELAKESPTESINPETALVRVKETVGGDIFRINTELLKVMKELGQYTQENINFIAQNKGSVQKCHWMPQHLKDVFRNAFETPMEAHLDLCAQRQPYIDQQQSINLYLSGSDTPEYIGNIHKKALLDDNINGLYYCYSSRGGNYERFGCDVCE